MHIFMAAIIDPWKRKERRKRSKTTCGEKASISKLLIQEATWIGISCTWA